MKAAAVWVSAAVSVKHVYLENAVLAPRARRLRKSQELSRLSF